MAWMHNVDYAKLSGIYGKWILLKSREDFQKVAKACQECEGFYIDPPEPPESYPVMAWFYDPGPSECGMFCKGIYFGLFEARELAEADGFKLELTEERKRRFSDNPEEW